MSDQTDTCRPTRLNTPVGEPVTDVAWVHRDILDLKTLDALVTTPEGIEKIRFAIIGKGRTLIGNQLIWDLNIRRHTPPPPGLWQRWRNRWAAGLPKRRDRLWSWFVLGIVALVLVVWAALGALDALLVLLRYPLASMLWIWNGLGAALPLIALVSAIGFLLWAASRERPFWFGAGVAAALAFPLLAAELQGAMALNPPGTAFPEGYDARARELATALIGITAQTYENLKPLWTPITLVFNGLGLAGVIATIDKLGGWAVELSAPPPGSVPGARRRKHPGRDKCRHLRL